MACREVAVTDNSDPDSSNYEYCRFQALGRSDYAGLMYICGKVNPEALFNDTNPAPLPANTLLHLLQTLGQRLDQDTELKLAYLENIAMTLGGLSRSSVHMEPFVASLDMISKALQGECRISRP